MLYENAVGEEFVDCARRMCLTLETRAESCTDDLVKPKTAGNRVMRADDARQIEYDDNDNKSFRRSLERL
jgi:hypothetical protein